MKILLIGSTGQLGTDLLRVNAVKSHPFDIVRVDRSQIDLAKTDLIIGVIRSIDFDAAIYCASFNRVDAAEGDPREAFLVNGHAAGEVARLCRQKKARMVYVSSDYVFDGKKGEPYREDDPPSPINLYGVSKLDGENLSRQECADTLVFRTASLFGVRGSTSKGTNFVESILAACRKNGAARVVNDITMSPTGTADLAPLILSAMEKKIPSGIYHAVNSGQATWFEFAREIVAQTKVPADVVPVPSSEYPTKAERPPMSVLDNSKLSAVIGPIPHWKESLTRYLREKGHVN